MASARASRRAIWIVGAVQCLNWGAVYYGFSVTLHPIATTFAVSETAISGAFSLGLLVMALAAPLVGHAIDRGHAPRTMRAGALLAAITLLASTAATSLIGLYLTWIALGLAMALMLYEPAFGLVQRAIEDPVERFRGLATVTIFGGLASTICIPLIAMLVDAAGWRWTHGALAMALLIGAVVMETLAFPALRDHADSAQESDSITPVRPRVPWRVGAPFALSTLAAMALSALLIATLIDRGQSPTAAAYVLALLGIMQLPGRLWVLSGRHGGSVATMLAGPLMLQAAGLAIVAISQGLPGVGIGVALFGVGAGWSTLARPMVIQALYGSAHAGSLNGSIARLQGFARAAGPLAAAAAYHAFGYATLFGTLAILLAALAAVAALIKPRSAVIAGVGKELISTAPRS